MLDLEIKSIKVHIYTDREIKASSIKIDEDPNVLKLQLGYYAYIHSAFGSNLGNALLQLAGYDPNQVDYAVPQDWWDQEHKRTGKAPNACWTYVEKDGKTSIFGRPLYWDSVRHDVAFVIFEELASWFTRRVQEANDIFRSIDG